MDENYAALSIVSAIAAIIEGFGSLGILLFTLYQIYCMKKERKQANVQTCFSIELEIYEARRRLSSASNEILKWQNEIAGWTDKKKKKHQKKTEELSVIYAESKEAYFSELDRFCSYILSKKLQECDFRKDWAPLLEDLMKGHRDEIEQNYENIARLNMRWNLRHG